MVLRNRPNYLDDNLLISRIERDLVLALQRELSALDHNDVNCLALALDIFDKANIERQRTANYLGVGTTTVSRWASKEIVPRAIAFRKSMLSGMHELMAEVVHTQEDRVLRLELKGAKRSVKSSQARSPAP